MRRIEIDRFLKTVLRPPAIAGSLADHSHQKIGRSGETLLPKMPLAFGDCFSKSSPVGQLGSSVQ